ncbi:hypothetical protein TTHERM_01075600 (macronuclear) [Tetrahymena thermophila SB210]|uniref:Calpain family cysteine protease n=1 Tax=Tetrahymena thermophila (strain SB210) TaxID=312017 RepID=Q22C80_TETTS|nr:hypothetical protein TTHERM_01075600 [Tetrahymena thermophila SB210]EAR82876.2 hypothetical protein TTHERM_01075600 [Tetrahymena thermophila SB210]|eukprot:XP_001030539.2 hypothetical protein TTHERM_01075600 [Tetrahymena thermophila SB210]
MRTKILLVKLFILVQVCYCQVLDNFVFTKTPLSNILYSQICSQNTPLKNIIALNSTNSSFIGWSNTCGVVIFNIDNNDDVSYTFLLQDASKVLKIFQSYTQSIWIIKNSQIQIYNKKEQKITNTLIYGGPSSNLIDVQEIPSEQVILIFTERQIQFIDTYNLVVLSSTYDIKTSDPSIMSALIISDKYLLLGQGYQINVIEFLNLSTQTNTVIAKSNGLVFTQYNTYVTRMVMLPNNAFAIQTSTQGIYFGNFTSFITTRNVQNITFQQQIQDKSYLQMQYIQTNLNQSYLIAEEAFNAIKIIQFQYTPSFNQFFYQLLPIYTKTYDLKLLFNSQYLISFTDKCVNIYKNITSNYQNQQPNILSINNNILYNSFKFVSNSGNRCFIQQNLLYYSKGTDGVIILNIDPINYTLQANNVLNIDSNSHSFAVQIYNTSQLVVGDSNLYFLNITNLQQPKIISNNSFNLQQINANYAIVSQNLNTIFVAAGYAGLMIVNITNFTNPNLISSISTNTPAQYSCSFIQTYLNEKYVIANYQNLGIYVYDVSYLNKPQTYSFFPISAGQDFSISITKFFMVISNSDYGIAIINITDLKNLSLISNIYIQGSTQRAYLISNDQYILTLSVFSGQLQLVDITNLKNPKIIQQYSYNNQISAYDLCLSSNYNTAYLAMGSGIVQFNLFTNKNLNINFFDCTDPNKIVSLNQNNWFSVGQQIGVQITEILPNVMRQVMITSAYYYNNFFQLQMLPTWSSFQLQQQMLMINIEKELLQQQVKNDSETIEFVFEIKEKLFNTDFIYSSIGITSQISQNIFNLCQQNQIVDSQSYVIQYKQNIISQAFSSFSSAQTNHILYVLNQKVISFPVIFNIQGSLQFQADLNLISTPSDQVSIQIITSPAQGVFINKQYKQLNVIFKQDLSGITLSGDLKSVNMILQQRLYFANFTNTNNISFNIIINDGLNYQITQLLTYSNCKFIKLNSPIFKNPKKSLQQDFESKNQNGKSLSVLTNFQYTFDSNIFLDKDSQSVSYSAYIQKDNNYILIPQNYWINFEKSSRTFYGQIDLSQYNQVIRLMVNATDGYTYSTDTFEIHLDIIPAYYVFTILFEIFLPLFVIITIYNHKSILINFLRRFKLLQMPLQIDLNKQYYLQIPILENCLEDGLEIWKSYKYTIIKQIVLRELTYLKLDKKTTEIDKNDNSCNDSRVHNDMTKSQNARMAQSTLNKSSAKQVQSKNNSKQLLNLSQKIVKNMSNQEVKQIQKHLKEQKVNYNYNCFIYMQKNGQLNYKNILDSIHKWCLKHYNKPKVLNDLQNPASLFSHFMIGLVSIYFAQIDKTAENVIQMLKQQALKEGLSEKDWTKMYVEFITDGDIVLYQPVPQPIYNQQKIDEQINLIQQLQQEISVSEFIMPLIKENLKAIALGFTSEKQSYFPIARKLSLDCYTHQIHCIKVYRPFEKKSFFNKQKVIEVEKEKELSLNSLLPSWINSVDIINGSLFFSIQAQTKDQGRYQIKIFSTQKIIIKVIYVNIGSPKTPEDKQQNEEDRDATITQQFSQQKQQDDNQSEYQSQNKQFDNISQYQDVILQNLHMSNQEQHYSNLDSPQPLRPFKKALSQYHSSAQSIYNQIGNRSIYKVNKLERLDSKKTFKDNRDDVSETNSHRFVGDADFEHVNSNVNSPKNSPIQQLDTKYKTLQNQFLNQNI